MLVFISFLFCTKTEITHCRQLNHNKLLHNKKTLDAFNELLSKHHIKYLMVNSFYIENGGQIWFFLTKKLSPAEQKALTQMSLEFFRNQNIHLIFCEGSQNNIEYLSNSFSVFPHEGSRKSQKQKKHLAWNERFDIQYIIKKLSYFVFGYIFYSIPYFVNTDGILCILLDKRFKEHMSAEKVKELNTQERVFEIALLNAIKDYPIKGIYIYHVKHIFLLKQEETYQEKN